MWWLAFVVAVPVLTACDPPGPVAPAWPERPTVHVDLYGDSLVVGALDEYATRSDGLFLTTVTAYPGATLATWHDRIRERPPSPHVVLALGTNDARVAGALDEWAATLDLLPASTCIVWPVPYEGSDEVASFNYDVLPVLTSHPNVTVVDWNTRVQGHPEWVQSDHMHYTLEGYAAYAQMLVDAALLCPRRPVATTKRRP